MPDAKPFILNPTNADFVAGTAPFKPHPESYHGCLQLYSAIFLVVAALLVILLLRGMYIFDQLHSAGVTTQARVTNHEVSSSSKGGTTYYLYLSFGDAGQPIESRASVDTEQYNRYDIGDLVTIRYLPSDTSVIVVDWDASAPPTLQWIAAGCLTLWIGFGSLGLFAIFFPRQKLFRLQRGGEKCSGIITKAQGTDDLDGYYKVIVDYTFQAPNGETIKGSDSCIREDLRKNLPRKGTPIVILYRNKRMFIAL